MEARRRKLERIENAFGFDLVCTVRCKSGSYRCSVLDYNALGFRLACEETSDFSEIITAEIESAQIHYGSLLLGELTFPDIGRTVDTERIIILLPSKRSRVNLVDRPKRVDVPYILEPLLIGPDPIRMREKLILRVENISTGGFRAKCSLSNRHLLPGMTLNNSSITLPLMGTFNCDFRIVATRVEGGYLIVGCEFVELSKELLTAIENFLLLCAMTTNDILPVHYEVRPKKTTSLLRIRRLDLILDRQALLALRFSAYFGANKLTENATLEDMSDVHDKNSIVIGAFIGKKLVGTMRVVFPREGSRFPFEDYFPFPAGFRREHCTELSKMAIDPDFQGSDIVFRLFQAAAIESIPKCEHAFLTATTALARNYLAIGATKVSESVPHPVLQGELMSLYVLKNENVKSGRMSALAWIGFFREAVDFLSRAGFTRRTKLPLFKFIRIPLELTAKRARKVLRRRSGRP